ncbi:TPM domain-containing protein [Cesiribacter andamanensis]|uniref:TPM domain-containing protein n=1 Tax=Cesiribacter andamanensis AMV16 TaxID=1279009 RepID=M7NK28_9BACT|nr:TPM domain-containing protein [Cesiribacter andamanensis]EMR02135.1 hypothetical protein ADICEAN_02746 [Cesiribacter andamanensis AMV16]
MKPLALPLVASLLLVSGACQQPFTASDENEVPVVASAIPEPRGRVNDYEGVLTEEEENELAAIIEAFEERTGNKILVITIRSRGPYESLQDYSSALGQAWNLRNDTNAIAIVLSRNLREVWVAYEIGGRTTISELEALRIADNVMVPYFADNRYFTGLRQGLIEITGSWGQ